MTLLDNLDILSLSYNIDQTTRQQLHSDHANAHA